MPADVPLSSALESAAIHLRRLDALATLTRLAGQAPDAIEGMSGRTVEDLGDLLMSEVLTVRGALRQAATAIGAEIVNL